MNKQEIRKLKIQVLLTAGLIGGCIVAAVATASQRWFFEKYCREKYVDLPGSLRSMSEAAEQDRIDPKLFGRLTREERLLLYDDWISRDDLRPRETPKALVAAARELYLARVERTLVCGNAEQRERALEFIRLAECPEAVPVLRRACGWWRKRNVAEAADRIQEAIDRLPPAASGATESSTGSPDLSITSKERGHER